MAQNHFIHDFEAKPFPTRGHMPMFEQNFKNLYFQSMLTLLGPFSGPNRPKWPKIVMSLLPRPKDFKQGVTCLFLRGQGGVLGQNFNMNLVKLML